MEQRNEKYCLYNRTDDKYKTNIKQTTWKRTNINVDYLNKYICDTTIMVSQINIYQLHLVSKLKYDAFAESTYKSWKFMSLELDFMQVLLY